MLSCKVIDPSPGKDAQAARDEFGHFITHRQKVNPVGRELQDKRGDDGSWDPDQPNGSNVDEKTSARISSGAEDPNDIKQV